MENKNKELFYNLGKIKYSEEDFKNLINDSNIPKEHYIYFLRKILKKIKLIIKKK
jgi:hypothetical protein